MSINIKEKNKGKFTKYAEDHGESVDLAASRILRNPQNYTPQLVKRAQFAKNAKHFKHKFGEGGNIFKIAAGVGLTIAGMPELGLPMAIGGAAAAIDDSGNKSMGGNNVLNRSLTDVKPIANPYGTYADGGKAVQKNSDDLKIYYGNSHKYGGINIDNHGQPSDTNTIANVEGGESEYNGYIFSDTLGVTKDGKPTDNPKEVHKTFSDLAKKVDKKYGGREDAIAKNTKNLEYNMISEKNETALDMKFSKTHNAFMKKYGGYMSDRYVLGGYPPSMDYMNPQVTIPGLTPFNVNPVQQIPETAPDAPPTFFDQGNLSLFQSNRRQQTSDNSLSKLPSVKPLLPTVSPVVPPPSNTTYRNPNTTGGQQLNLPQFNPIYNKTLSQAGFNNSLDMSIPKLNPDQANNMSNIMDNKRLNFNNPSSTQKTMNPNISAEKDAAMGSNSGTPLDYTQYISPAINAVGALIGATSKPHNYHAVVDRSPLNTLDQIPTDGDYTQLYNRNQRNLEAANNTVGNYNPSVAASLRAGNLSAKLNADNEVGLNGVNTSLTNRANKFMAKAQMQSSMDNLQQEYNHQYSVENAQDKAKQLDNTLQYASNMGKDIQGIRNDKDTAKVINQMLQYYKIDTSNPFWGNEVLKYNNTPQMFQYLSGLGVVNTNANTTGN